MISLPKIFRISYTFSSCNPIQMLKTLESVTESNKRLEKENQDLNEMVQQLTKQKDNALTRYVDGITSEK